MDDELYGFPSTTGDYSMQPPEIMVSPGSFCQGFPCFPAYGPDPLVSGSSGISDAASMVAEIQRVGTEEEVSSAIRAQIASHPLYPKLLEAYIGCQKVGAPPEVVSVLDEIRRESVVVCNKTNVVPSCLGADPELDHFMETYCDMLMKYKSDLSRPFDEATTFLNNIETQLASLCNGASPTLLDSAWMFPWLKA